MRSKRCAALAVSMSTVSARVISTVAMIPVGMPSLFTSAGLCVMSAAYSWTRDPPKTRCVWQSTKPGATIFPVASMTWAELVSTSSAISDEEPMATMRSPAIAIDASTLRPMGSSTVGTQVNTSFAPAMIKSALGLARGSLFMSGQSSIACVASAINGAFLRAKGCVRTPPEWHLDLFVGERALAFAHLASQLIASLGVANNPNA